MLKISEEEKKALKGRGIILSNDGEHFVVRVVSSNGVFTAEQLRALSDAAEKYGSGKIAMTVRLTVEIQGVTYENIEPLAAAVEAVGLVTGGTGSVVRPIVPCKGSVCVHGLQDTQKFADGLFNEFYLGWHSVKLPHKFKIAIGGCPNNCVKPALHDFGCYGQSVPEFHADECRACGKCACIDKCPVKACSRGDDGRLVIDWDKCTNCGKCIPACHFGAVHEKERGYAVYIGGIWGKTQRLGTRVPGVFSEKEVHDLIEKAILLFREQGVTGERFGRTVDRVGVDKFIGMLLGDEVLARKEQILAEPKHTTGGASC